MKDKSDVTFLVVSCDKYSDLWPMFFSQMKTNWPDCPFSISLITNESDFFCEGVSVIKTGPDVGYSNQVREAVQKIDTKWVVLWLEDSILSERIDSKRVEGLIQSAIDSNVGYLKLSADYPLSYLPNGDFEFGVIPKRVRYRAAVGMALYRRDVLFKLFPPGMNAWELDKSTLSNELPDAFCCLTMKAARRPPLPYVNSVIKGRWYLPAIPFIRRVGFKDSLANRKRQTVREFAVCVAFLFWVEVLKLFRIHWLDSSSKRL